MGAFEDFLGSSTGGLASSGASGLLSFGLGQIGAAIQWNREKKKMKIQQENALERMAKSQEYNLANMEKQNEYQIAAEQRANEYNSIGSQVERARQAGVSPLAAIGSGGAGGLMSVSSAPSGAIPSGSSPSGGAPAGPQAQYFDFARAADIGADIQLKKSQASVAEAQASYYESLTTGKNIENYIQENTKETQIRIENLKAKGLDLTNKAQEFNNSVQQISFATDQALKQQAILKASAELYQIYNSELRADALADSTVKLQAKQLMLTVAKTRETNANVEKIEAETITEGARYLATLSESDYYDAMATLGWKDADLKEIQKELSQFEFEFRQSHAEEDRKFQRSSERWQRAFNGINSLSNAAYAACAVAGTVVTGGYGGVFAAGGGRVPQKYQGKSPNTIGY